MAKTNNTDDNQLIGFLGIIFFTILIILFATEQAEKLTKLINLATLLVVGYYTYATRQMHNQMVRQNQLSLIPAFAVVYATPFKGNESDDFLKLTNFGNGTAINIKVSNIKTKQFANSIIGELDYEVRFRNVPYLEKSSSTRLNFEVYGMSGDLIAPNSPIDFLRNRGEDGRMKKKEFTLSLSFRDIEGNEYTQSIFVSPRGCVPELVKAVESS
jgi:hypothetical protein